MDELEKYFDKIDIRIDMFQALIDIMPKSTVGYINQKHSVRIYNSLKNNCSYSFLDEISI